jgi:hypothetical protein
LSVIDKEKFDPTIEPTSDKTHRILRSAIGLSPFGSGTALEALNLVFEDPYNARRTKWLNELSDAINSQSIDIESLHANAENSNAVLSAILQSTDIAIKTGNQSTHTILIRFILKTIGTQQPDEELNSIYLTTLRQLTASHLALLNLISNRTRYEHGAELEKYEAILFAEIKKCEVISKSIPPTRLLSDLDSMQLIYSPSGSPWQSSQTNYSTMMLSDFAQGFIEYIEET